MQRGFYTSVGCVVLKSSCICVVCAVCCHVTVSHQAALCTDPIPTIGLRRPLGTDARRRRFWVLGGAAGAWRVFCEEGDGSNWVSTCTSHLQGGGTALVFASQSKHVGVVDCVLPLYHVCAVTCPSRRPLTAFRRYMHSSGMGFCCC